MDLTISILIDHKELKKFNSNVEIHVFECLTRKIKFFTWLKISETLISNKWIIILIYKQIKYIIESNIRINKEIKYLIYNKYILYSMYIKYFINIKWFINI